MVLSFKQGDLPVEDGKQCKICGKPIVFGEIYVRDRKNDQPKHVQCDRFGEINIDVLPHILLGRFYGDSSRESRKAVADEYVLLRPFVEACYGEGFILFMDKEILDPQ